MDIPESPGVSGQRLPDPGGPGAGPPGPRASDADRDRAAAVLRAAAGDGRLAAGELEQRLDLVLQATSRAEVAEAVQDLAPAAEPSGTVVAGDTGVLHDFVRRGRWKVDGQYRSTVVVGSGVIDLRHAEFTAPQTTIRINNWVGSVFIIVPEDADVRMDGGGFVGGFHDNRAHRAEYPQGPRITVTGRAMAGSVFVVGELPEAMRRRLERRDRRKGIGA